MCEPGQFARRRYACTGLPGTTPAQTCRKQRFVGRVRRQLPPDETRAFAKPFSHHPQGPKRGPDYWQCASLGNLPGGATLARAYQERRLRRSAGNSALSVGPGASRHPTKPAHSLNHFLTTLRAPNGALITGNVRAWAICPAALRLHGPTRNDACAGLPETALCRSGQAPAATRRNPRIR